MAFGKHGYTSGGSIHGKGHAPMDADPDDTESSLHHSPAGDSSFGGTGEDMDHLGHGAPPMHETEGKLAALKAIGHHARAAMAMQMREKMPKAPAPEHDVSRAEEDGSRGALSGGDDDRAHAEKLKRVMMARQG